MIPALLLGICGALLAASSQPAAVEVDGIRVRASFSPPVAAEGENVAIELTLEDVAGGRPLTGLKPGAWLAARRGDRAPRGRECTARAAAFVGNSLLDRPAADLNGYYVLVLNEDASIFVVDPRFSFGGSRLLAMLPLEAPGMDWAASPDGATLFVSLPAVGKLAVADLVSWTVRTSVDVGPEAGAVALEPGGERVWVETRDGVAVVDARSLERTHVITLGAGVHRLAVDSDSRHVFATAAGGVAVIDARDPDRRRVVPLDGAAPSVLAFSEAAGFAYAGDPDSGRVFAIDAARARPVARLDAEPGFTQVRFAPSGRLGFLPNPDKAIVQVFDAATNRIVRTVDVRDGPDQVTFTDTLAYVRRRRSDVVVMIPLAGLEREDERTGVADFPGGEHALAAPLPALADSIVSAPDGPAVLVANPLDRTVYYYREGMAAPMGGFANFSRQPRAALVVDRSLREKPGGRYATTTRLPAASLFDLVVFLDAPRLVACFELPVEARPGRASAAPAPPRVALAGAASFRVGEPALLRVRLSDAEGRPRRGLSDVEALVVQAPGVWQRRLPLVDAGGGVYQADLAPPEAGLLSLWVESPAAGLALASSPPLMLESRR